MKRTSFVVLCGLFIVCFLLSCHFNHHGINIHVSDSEDAYKMYARYDPEKTRDVEEYMNYKIGRQSNMSFLNTHIDGQLTMDDHSTFYIKKYPGYLEINLNKDKNSTEAYLRIKHMCEGLKKVMTQ